MTKTIRNTALLALAISLTGALSVAQTSGDAIYKAKCQACHGANGVPSPGMAKMMGIKPVSDPAMQKLTVEQIMDTVKNGHGKMKPVTGLSDAQVHAVATYFKSLGK
jgi:cytochrome c6